MVKQKNRIQLPTAKNLTEALKHIPKWKSAVIIPQQWVDIFDMNPGLIGGLTPELMKEFNDKVDGKLAQAEMSRAYKETFILGLEAHKEIEANRAECVELMVDAKIEEDESVMRAALAGTRYEQHLAQWNHELAGRQGLLRDQTEYVNQTTDVDISVQLQKSFAQHESTRARLEASLTQNAATQVIDVEAQELKEAKAIEDKTARSRFKKMITRGG